MPHWIFQCPLCGAELIYAEIAMDLALSELCFPRKPDFPSEGLALECSHCRKTCVFQRQQLTYRVT
jgi:hypothetical protein